MASSPASHLTKLLGSLAVLFAMSCSASSPSASTELTLDTFCSANIDAACESGHRCGEATADLGICRNALTPLLDGCPKIVALAKEGKTHFDSAAAARYIEAIRNKSCVQGDVPSLHGAFVGTLGDGEACTNAVECAQDSICNVTCQHLRVAGEMCVENVDVDPVAFRCGQGLQCATSSTHVCESAPLLGGTAAGGTCSGAYSCGVGLGCSDEGVCVPKGDVNETCTAMTCRLGLVCVANRCAVH
jgi:hypothetical protein